MPSPTYQELKEELWKVSYQLDFERTKNEHLMRSFSKPTGIITTDGEVKWTHFSGDAGKQVERLEVIESVVLVLLGFIIGILCK